MLDNPVLRPSDITDIPQWKLGLSTADFANHEAMRDVLRGIFNAEWAKRGYRRSP